MFFLTLKLQNVNNFMGLFASNNKRFIIWCYCFLLSFSFLLICSKSSPLYPFNDWTDANAFFTMGKGMMHGKVLYRDLFEQKGPLLYFIYGLASIISTKSFIGVFVIEVIAFSIFLFFTYRSLTLWIDKRSSLIYLLIISAIVPNLKSFAHGGSAEELSLPLMAISLFYFLAFIKNKIPNQNIINITLGIGVIAGCIFWIKFSMIGFWMGWVISVILINLVTKKYLLSVKILLYFLAGFTLATIPWIIYFGINHAVYDWINTYIIINLNSYAVQVPFTFRFLFLIAGIEFQFHKNLLFNLFFWSGVITFISFKKFLSTWLEKLSVAICIFLHFFVLYAGGKGYIYYSLITAPYIVFGFIVINTVLRLDTIIFSKKFLYIFISVFFVSTSLLSLKYNQNVYFLKVNKRDLVQYRFATMINQSRNPTLLNYGSLDGGFYFASDTIPSVRFFINQNFDYAQFPLIMDEQNRYIKEKMIDFVIIKLPDEIVLKRLESNVPDLILNYELIRVEKQFYGDEEDVYFLFQKRT